MATEDEVRQASSQFYAALNQMLKGDASSMSAIWSHGAVTTMHPIGGREVGWDAVRGSFEQVAKAPIGGNVELKDQLIEVYGDLAYEMGTESGQMSLAGHQAPIDQRVTNIYHREDGTWKIIHHHGDVSPAMMEILQHM